MEERLLLLRLAYFLSAVTCGWACVKDLHELEHALLNDPRNLNNLTIGFFPANLQTSAVVEVFYHLNGTEWNEEDYNPRLSPPGCVSASQTPSLSCRSVINIGYSTSARRFSDLLTEGEAVGQLNC